MPIAYCNLTSDLISVCKNIEDYKPIKTLISTNWELVSGAVYRYENSGYVELLQDDGIPLTAETTETTTPSAGKFSYYSDTDILYVRIGNDGNPASSVMQSTVDWDAYKQKCRNDAQEMLEGFLKKVYAVPFQKIVAPNASYNSRDYDYWIRRATALLTCYILIGSANPEDRNAQLLYNQVDYVNPEVGENMGIVQRILNGEIELRTQLSNREKGGFNVYEGSVTSDAYLKLTGRYYGAEKRVWRIQIDGAGTPGTATYKLSLDGGSNWDQTTQKTRDTNTDNRRVLIWDGVYAEFVGTFEVGEYWDIELFPYSDVPEVYSVGAISVSRN